MSNRGRVRPGAKHPRGSVVLVEVWTYLSERGIEVEGTAMNGDLTAVESGRAELLVRSLVEVYGEVAKRFLVGEGFRDVRSTGVRNR